MSRTHFNRDQVTAGDTLANIMRTIQALRRSIKGDKDKPQVSIAPKSAVAIVPPKKVSVLCLSVLYFWFSVNLTRFSSHMVRC